MSFDIRKRFISFAEGANQKRLMPYQIRVAIRIILSVWRGLGAEIGILFCRQSGKTEAVSLSIAFLCLAVCIFWQFNPSWHRRFDDGLRIGIFSPKGEQGQTDLTRARRALPRMVLLGLGYRIESDNKSELQVVKDEATRERVVFLVKAISASEGSNIESETFDLIIVEEAQDITQRKFEAEIEPMGAARDATIAFVGTVGFTRDMFYKTLKRLEARESGDYFNVDYKEVIAANFRDGAYERFVRRIITTRGEESDYFKMKFKNQWVLEVGHPFTPKRFRALCDFETNWRELCHELPEGIFLVAGLDVAKDVDDSILMLGTADFRRIDYENNPYPDVTMIWAQEWHGVNYDQQFAEMDAHLEEFFPILKSEGTLAIDHTGARGDMVSRFESGGYTVIPAVFSPGTKTGKGLLCQQLMDQVNTNHFAFAAGTEEIVGSEFRYDFNVPKGHEVLPGDKRWAKMQEQFTNLVREYKGTRLDLHAESEHEHDDYPMAAVLMVHAARCHIYTDLREIGSVGRRSTSQLAQELQNEGGAFGDAPDTNYEEWG